MAGDLPDEANRFDGAPAPNTHPSAMPSDEELEQARESHEAAKAFVAEVLSEAGVDSLTLYQYPQQNTFDVSVRELAEQQGRKEEYIERLDKRHDKRGAYATRVIQEAASDAGIPVTKEKKTRDR